MFLYFIRVWLFPTIYALIIAFMLYGCSSETVYGTFHVKCHSNGTVIFDEEVVTSYMSHFRKKVWWRNDGLGKQRGITEVGGDCVVRRLK